MTFDGLGRSAKIVENSGGSPTSTKQFVFDKDERCEERDGTGASTKRFFKRGQTVGAASYFYTLDQLSSIREMTDASGTIQAQYLFDPYGRSMRQQGLLDSDFRYAGYYHHGPSNLNWTYTRAYSPQIGRFLNRDLIGEAGGINLFSYVSNSPTILVDPSGLTDDCCIDWSKVRDSANLGTAAGVAIGSYIGGGGGGLGGALAGGGVGAVPGSAAGAYAGAA
ncbi:MAG: RHS repeat-associated core domain-containing protein, partial [Candidatus Obscuribacterales bacterium]|nr:RHS repeat-associated core domain-containing protein [Candidatus Obscuribacterales bacterium]